MVQVKGPSMLPTLQPGDRLLVRPMRSNDPPLQPGVVILSWHPQHQHIRVIKRLIHRETEGLWVLGDNQAVSTDSRQFGLIPKDCLIGTVVALIRTSPVMSSAARWHR